MSIVYSGHRIRYKNDLAGQVWYGKGQGFSRLSEVVRFMQERLEASHQSYLGGGDPTCGEILFARNRGFFRDVSTYNTPKITFYCIFINKFRKKCSKIFQFKKKS